MIKQTIDAGKVTDVPPVVLDLVRLHAIAMPKIGMRNVITSLDQAGDGPSRCQVTTLVITLATARVKMRDGEGNERNERENAKKRRKK